MPIQVRWDRSEPDTLDIVFNMPWIWQEIYDIRDLVRFMIEGVNGTVHILYDMRGCRVPAGNAAPHLRNFTMNLPVQAREGLHIFVGSNPDWKAHMTLFTRTYPDLALDVVYVSNREDGMRAIRAKKEQLDLLDEEDGHSGATAPNETAQSIRDTQPTASVADTVEAETWQPVYTSR